MKVIKASLIIAALSVCLFACSKSGSSSSTATVTIQGNWSSVNEQILGFFDGTQVLDSTVTPASGDYANFSSGGTLYAQVGGIKDTSTYTLINSASVSFSYLGTLDTFAIKGLTSTSCTLSYVSPVRDTTVNLGTGNLTGPAYGVINISLSR